MDRPLEGKVALVTGSSRHIGKGIAVELGAAGAQVWISARKLGDSADDVGTLRATAAAIEAQGGEAVPVQCDSGDDEAVAALFAQIAERAGRLDVLVNNASPDFASMVGKRFWDIPTEQMTACLWVGPRSNFVASAHAARMMIPAGQGLIVNVSSHGSKEYMLSLPYGAGKAAMEKITHDSGLELREHGVAVVSLWPGFVTEREVAPTAPQVTSAVDRRLAEMTAHFGESPRFCGRAVVALATDPDVMRWTAAAITTRRAAAEYGFTDVDGHQPPQEMRINRHLPADQLPPLLTLLEPFEPSEVHSYE
jgi:NAD(P)-dependent dehydrogenase (short-subunit alcohol dehydrogenase family)